MSSPPCGAAWIVWLAASFLFLSTVACDRYRSEREFPPGQEPDLVENDKSNLGEDEEHSHLRGAMGGVIASLGRDRYHVEAVLQDDHLIALYVLTDDVTELKEVPQQFLTAYLKSPNLPMATVIGLQSDPLPGDPGNMTTRFTGELPESLRNQTVSMVVPGLQIDGQRFAARFELSSVVSNTMPTPATDEEAEQIYLTAGGLYTEADIEANGRQSAANKYRAFRAQHDPNPQPGDWICPITKTKANQQCSWIIQGQTYYFCCPPCIDEFLGLAKSNPAAILDAEDYRH